MCVRVHVFVSMSVCVLVHVCSVHVCDSVCVYVHVCMHACLLFEEKQEY